MSLASPFKKETNLEIRHLMNLVKDPTSVRDSSNAQDQLVKILPHYRLTSLDDLKIFKQIERSNVPELSISVRTNKSFIELENSIDGKVTVLLDDITKYAIENDKFFNGIHTYLINLREDLIRGSNTEPLTHDLPRNKTFGRNLLIELSSIAKGNAASKKAALPLITEKINEFTSRICV